MKFSLKMKPLLITAVLSAAAILAVPPATAAPAPSEAKPAAAADDIGVFLKVSSFPEQSILQTMPYGANQMLALTHSGHLYSYSTPTDLWTRIQGTRLTEYNAMVKLADGRIMLLAGLRNGESFYVANEIYDPKTKVFHSAADVPIPLHYPEVRAITKKDGNVLLTAKYAMYGYYHYKMYEYNPSTDIWTEPYPVNYTGNAFEMNDAGDVLSYSGGLSEHFTHGQYYNAKQNRWYTTATMPYVISDSATTSLADGTFFLAGGTEGGGDSIKPTPRALLFLPDRNQWRQVAPMKEARAYPASVLLPDGRVLVVGGYGSGTRFTNSTEIYNPKTDTWTAGPPMKYKHEHPHAELLPNGALLVTGRDGIGEEEIVSMEMLVLPKVIRRGTNTYDYDLHAESLGNVPGTVVATKTLFVKDGWTYKTLYVVEPNVYYTLTRNSISYHRMYTIREKNGVKEIVIDSDHVFLKLQDGLLYFIQDGYLKKLKLDEAYGETILFPNSFAVDPSQESRSNALGYHVVAGTPIQVNMQAFDGTYIYAWWGYEGSRETSGFPVRIPITGDRVDVLSTRVNAYYRGTFDLIGDTLYYAAMNHEGLPGIDLLAVKKDGSDEKTLATVQRYFIDDSHVYYTDALDVVKSAIGGSGGKLKMMKLDGSGKKLLDGNSAEGILFSEKYLYYESYNSNQIVRVDKVGTNRKVIANGGSKYRYYLLKATDSYVEYVKEDKKRYQVLGTFRLDVSTMKETLIEKAES
ncbi:DUF5050 domain-containing protein [Paenibacillus sp. TRM 82003]|nr:DUF5050 domain-containing protein [Paenibacillus sp. TRM 82003]